MTAVPISAILVPSEKGNRHIVVLPFTEREQLLYTRLVAYLDSSMFLRVFRRVSSSGILRMLEIYSIGDHIGPDEKTQVSKSAINIHASIDLDKVYESVELKSINSNLLGANSWHMGCYYQSENCVEQYFFSVEKLSELIYDRKFTLGGK